MAAHPVTVEAFAAQLNAVRQLPFEAVKLGALPDAGCLPLLTDWLSGLNVPVILDPVLTPRPGKHWACRPRPRAVLPYCTLVTPNVPEALALTGLPAETELLRWLRPWARWVAMFTSKVVMPPTADSGFTDRLRRRLPAMAPSQSNTAPDGGGASLATATPAPLSFSAGTGCTLATALAAFLAQGEVLADACVLANAYVAQGLKAGYAVSAARGPIDQQGGRCPRRLSNRDR